jgi:hypothetical protein
MNVFDDGKYCLGWVQEKKKWGATKAVLELKSAETTNWTGVIGIYLARNREYRLTKWKTEG